MIPGRLVFTIALLFSFHGIAAYCQSVPGADTLAAEKFFYAGARVHYGSMIIHSRAIKDIGNAYPLGLELTLGRHTATGQARDACNCYPKSGVILGLWDFDKPEILGRGVSAIAFIEPVFGARKRFSFSIRAGVGFAWLSHPYNPVTNPFNFSYSTHVAFPLLLGTVLDYRISQGTLLNFGILYNHISNGGLREPNKGINWPTIALGLDFFRQPPRFPQREVSDWKQTDMQRVQRNVYLFGTARQLNHEELKKYPVLGMEAWVNYRVSRLSRLGAGTLFLYDGSDGEEIRRNPLSEADPCRAGLMLGHGFLLGRFVFSQAFGVYLYDSYKAADPVYQRYSLTHPLGKHLEAGVSLMAHRHVADFLDFRLGWRF